MPYLEVQIRLIPDSESGGLEDQSQLVHVTGFPCSEFGPGPWNNANCSSLMQDLQVFLQNRIGEFRSPAYNPFTRVVLARPRSEGNIADYPQTMEEILETMVLNGITVDQEVVKRLRAESLGVHKEPDAPLPPTRFEREDVI
jgi:hypothetical protein